MRRLATALLVTLTVAIAGAIGLLAGPPGAGAATRATPASPPTITRSARVAYLSCHAPGVLLTASIQRAAFAPGQLVTYRVSIRNLSHTACGYANGITATTNPVIGGKGLLGPCGALSVVIDDERGSQVYPGPIALSCPALLGPGLQAGRTITATGTWNPSLQIDGVARPGYAPTVRPGVYHMVVDGKVTLPIDLEGSPNVLSPPGTLPPSTSPPAPPPVPSPLPLPDVPAPTVPSHVPSPPFPPITSTPPGHSVTRSAHVAFDGCPAKQVTLTVTIPAASSTSAPVRYDVAVHNGGNAPCGEAFRGDPPSVRRFRVGPCSSMPASVVNGFGVDVYPGPQIFMCPMFAGPYLAPHTTVTATATWPGTEYVASPGGGAPQPRAAPPGPYVLVVDRAVRVPFTLTASP